MTKCFFLIAWFALVMHHAYSQHSLKGMVSDADGQPVPYAHVILSSTFAGTHTGVDGSYLIRNLRPGDYTLEVSCIGYARTSKVISVNGETTCHVKLEPSVLLSDEVVIQAQALDARTPVAYREVNAGTIRSDNSGQDITYIMSLTPSMVVSSDAGTGIGYTGINIRGTDVKRINVTVNGIPLNDAESHGVFWVNMPDFASSVQSLQIQRGVGTSTNGAGAFGATINMQTTTLNEKPYAEIASSAGSFNSFKNTVSVGTGLLNNHFTFDARLSKIESDGFIDRAYSDLKSFYFSGGWHSKAGILKATIFSGKEITYQAWWGVPKVKLLNDTAGMRRYLDHWLFTQEEYDHMVNSDSRTYNYYTYENEIDHYQQDHYQLHFSREFSKNWYLNAALHYTYGRGYFEGYKTGDDFADYALPMFILGADTVASTDFITRKWLDNDFGGGVASIRYLKGKWDMVTGGGYNYYAGRHFGDIVWAKIVTYTDETKRWYHSTGDKSDGNVFVKGHYQLTSRLSSYADIQVRSIEYAIKGNDDDLRDVTQDRSYLFFNPKAGLTYQPGGGQRMYLSFATAHREPTRSDFTDADSGLVPKPERLNDYELGYHIHRPTYYAGMNVYYMDYKDQLILTGQINNVGAPIMMNAPRSFRMGVEFEAAVKFHNTIEVAGNMTLSRNLIFNFTEYIDDWDNGGQVWMQLGNPNISFSPSVISALSIKAEPFKNLTTELRSKYVGRQYIDNTSSLDRSLDPYLVSDLLVSYKLTPGWASGVEIQGKVINLFDEEYETYAWVYRYLYGGKEYTMDGYFPQAGRNFMLGLVMRF